MTRRDVCRNCFSRNVGCDEDTVIWCDDCPFIISEEDDPEDLKVMEEEHEASVRAAYEEDDALPPNYDSDDDPHPDTQEFHGDY